MNDNYTHISYVLDKSGSMQYVRAAAVSAFNEFLDDQQRAEGHTTFGLTLFDTRVTRVHTAVDVHEVRPLGDGTPYQPSGMTALFDAVGETITATGNALAALPEPKRPARVLFVVHTDGHENSSREYDQRQVSSMRQHQEDTYGWTFLFIAADQDAWDNPLGVRAVNTISYDNTAVGTQEAGQKVASMTRAYREAPGGQTVPLAAAPTDLRKNRPDRS